MIKYFEIIGLHGKPNNDFKFPFNPDLNILTGKNGSGKTTILKLLWYCLSGNVDRIRSEIVFKKTTLETSSFKLVVTMDSESPSKDISFHLEIGESKFSFAQQPFIGNLLLGNYPAFSQPDPAEQAKEQIVSLEDSSVFFPTFRRIEGGYSLERRRRGNRASALQAALSEFPDALDTGNHHFVASISTDDIVLLLTRKYAEISQHTNRLHRELSESITTTIRDYDYAARLGGPDKAKLANADTTLAQIKSEISRTEEKRDALLRPFVVLADLVSRIFKHRGIQMTDAITFGEAAQSITSDKLSAGEKQMLSFLCYNAFNSNSCIFIDEPEISLHVDWQRTLFPTLLEQSTTNQFIITTHSPFIYSKFSDKELILNSDRGDA